MSGATGGAPATEDVVTDTGAKPGADGADDNGAGRTGDDNDDGDGREPLSAEELSKRYANVRESLRRERLEKRQLADRLAEREREREQRASPKGKGARQDNDDDEIELPDEDELDKSPRDAVAKLLKYARKMREMQTKQAEEEGQSSKREAFVQSTQKFMQAAEAEFRQDHPDYEDAVKHFKTVLREDFEDQGLRGDGLKDAVGKELLRLVHNARTNGGDPAELIYKLAIKRGHKSKKAEAELDTVERGMKSSPNFPRGGGQKGGFSKKALLEADGKDFDKQWAEYEKQATRG